MIPDPPAKLSRGDRLLWILVMGVLGLAAAVAVAAFLLTRDPTTEIVVDNDTSDDVNVSYEPELIGGDATEFEVLSGESVHRELEPETKYGSRECTIGPIVARGPSGRVVARLPAGLCWQGRLEWPLSAPRSD